MHRTALLRAAAGLAWLMLTALPASAQSLSKAVLEELNLARTQPAAYADILLQEAQSGRSPATFAYEPQRDLYEAVDFLRRQRPLAPLRDSAGLEQAALSHADRQGYEGGFGHVSSSGESLSERLHRSGVWAGIMAEDISYGYHTPRDVLRQLIVDSGVPGRGHRANIFGAAYQLAGVSCGPHRVYGSMCVVDFAGSLAGAR